LCAVSWVFLLLLNALSGIGGTLRAGSPFGVGFGIPPAMEIIPYWIGVAGDVVALLCIFFASFWFGSVAVRFIYKGPISGVKYPLRGVIGGLIIALGAMGVSLVGLAFGKVFAVLGAIILAKIAVGIWRGDEKLRHRLGRVRVSLGPLWPFLSMFLPVSILILVSALAPAVDSDVLSVHFGNPLAILRLHKMVEYPFSVHDDYPPIWEMLLLPLIGSGHEGAARLMGPMMLAVVSLQVFQLARRLVAVPWALLGAGLFISNPYLSGYSIVAKNDLFVAVIGMTAISAALDAGKARMGADMLLCGVLVGVSFASKYSSAFLLVSIMLILAVDARMSLRGLFIMAGGCAVPLFPVAARNFLFTGDPLYPFLSSFFAGPFSSAISRKRLWEHYAFVTQQDPREMTYYSSITGAFRRIYAGRDSFSGFMVLLPFMVFCGRWSREYRAVLLCWLVLFAGWFIGPAQVRYGILLYPLGYTLAIAGVAAAGRTGRAASWAVICFQVIASMGSLFFMDYWRAGAGLERGESFISAKLTTFKEAVDEVNRICSPLDRILAIGSTRIASFRSRVDHGAFAAAANPVFSLVHESGSGTQLMKKFRQNGWNYLLYNSMDAFYWRRIYADDKWTERDIRLWADFWSRQAAPVWEGRTEDSLEGHFYLFHLGRAGRGRYLGILPGIEGQEYLMEEDARKKDEKAMRARMAMLRRAAGDFGMVDYFDWGIFQGLYTPAGEYELLTRAYGRGFSNFQTLAFLYYLSFATGRGGMADVWMNRALERNPRATRESVMRNLYER